MWSLDGYPGSALALLGLLCALSDLNHLFIFESQLQSCIITFFSFYSRSVFIHNLTDTLQCELGGGSHCGPLGALSLGVLCNICGKSKLCF